MALDQVNDALLPRNSAHEEDVGHVRIDPQFRQPTGIWPGAEFHRIDAVGDDVDSVWIHVKRAQNVLFGVVGDCDRRRRPFQSRFFPARA